MIDKRLLICCLFILPPALAVFASDNPELDQFYNSVLEEKQKEEVRVEPSILDRLYKPLVPKNKLFFGLDAQYFNNDNYSNDGTATVDKYLRGARYTTLGSLLKISPLKWLEAGVGFSEILPQDRKEEVFNRPEEELTTVNYYKLNYFQDYTFSLRARAQAMEAYLNIEEKRQRSKRKVQTLPNPPNTFNRILSHFEDFNLGLRYVSGSAAQVDSSNLSKLDRPLMGDGQLNLEGQIGYRAGKVKRNIYYTSGSTDSIYIYNKLYYHLLPEVNLRYGLSKDAEVETGLSYATPFKYKAEQDQYYTNATSRFTVGTYHLENNFCLPLRMRLRPLDNLQLAFSSDSSYADQRLDYYKKNTDGSITNYEAKKISYFNTKPSIGLTYLFDADKEIEEDEFSLLTKDLLRKNQFLANFIFEKDITHLWKNAAATTQNIIDPYNIFLYPLDFYLYNTEYATISAGNATSFATNILPQNYYQIKASFDYGLTDALNMDLTLGYHSSSALHHFTFYGLSDCFYKFKPYYFIDFSADWRITPNSALSFNSYFVPEYHVSLDIGQPYEYRSKSRYYNLSLSLKALF
jgi:hypothetical protein